MIAVSVRRKNVQVVSGCFFQGDDGRRRGDERGSNSISWISRPAVVDAVDQSIESSSRGLVLT